MDSFVLKGSVTGGMSDEEFLRFCQDNPDLRIERNSNLEIIIMSPVNSLSGFYSGEVYGQLRDWNRKYKKGIVFDSSAGFTLPDRSVLSPDASWISSESWSKLSEEEKNRFAPVCPEFVVEVRSKSDHLPDLKKKMKVWIRNGAYSAWLIDPIDRVVCLFTKDGKEETVEDFEKKIEGEGPIAGFVLDLSLLKI